MYIYLWYFITIELSPTVSVFKPSISSFYLVFDVTDNSQENQLTGQILVVNSTNLALIEDPFTICHNQVENITNKWTKFWLDENNTKVFGQHLKLNLWEETKNPPNNTSNTVEHYNGSIRLLSLAGKEELVLEDGKMDRAQCRGFVGDNLLEAPKDLKRLLLSRLIYGWMLDISSHIYVSQWRHSMAFHLKEIAKVLYQFPCVLLYHIKINENKFKYTGQTRQNWD